MNDANSPHIILQLGSISSGIGNRRGREQGVGVTKELAMKSLVHFMFVSRVCCILSKLGMLLGHQSFVHSHPMHCFQVHGLPRIKQLT